MNTEDLRAFVQVVDSGGFTAGGRVLGRSTKYVSRQIHRLEQAVGCHLLERTTRAVAPTEAGARLYTHAQRILVELGEASAALAGDDPVAGRLRVAMPTLSVAAGVTDWVDALRREHPRLLIQLHVTDQPVDLVADGVDLQVMASPPAQTTFVVRRLLTLAFGLAAHERYLATRPAPAAPADLADHECLLFVSDLPQTSWTLHRGEEIVSVPVRGGLQSSSSDVLFRALHAGLGIGICPHAWLTGSSGPPGIRAVLPDWRFQPMPLYAVTPRTARRSARVQAFLDRTVTGLEQWIGA